MEQAIGILREDRYYDLHGMDAARVLTEEGERFMRENKGHKAVYALAEVVRIRNYPGYQTVPENSPEHKSRALLLLLSAQVEEAIRVLDPAMEGFFERAKVWRVFFPRAPVEARATWRLT